MLSEHTKLRVLLVDDDQERLALLEKALETEGHQVVAQLNTHADLTMAVAVHKPEVVFIDVGLPGRDILQSLGEMYREHPRPIVLWAEQSDAQTTRRALDAGVSAYVVDDLQHRRNFSALLDLAIARFEMQQALHQELDRAKTRLADLRDLERSGPEGSAPSSRRRLVRLVSSVRAIAPLPSPHGERSGRRLSEPWRGLRRPAR